ncbi:hypothetical protein Tdes44962_MAKER00386 [Teratosphaeria destructans]|uniref:Uncharacterized protein n=1 Tax=Teratosphaeria destructans TaxID=418781 RepID=A0A9W7SS20_9PEZI|nr:hypothetical protein Tdes44962_MAKER00386 [Teratosphaeria destructans]
MTQRGINRWPKSRPLGDAASALTPDRDKAVRAKSDAGIKRGLAKPASFRRQQPGENKGN